MPCLYFNKQLLESPGYTTRLYNFTPSQRLLKTPHISGLAGSFPVHRIFLAICSIHKKQRMSKNIFVSSKRYRANTLAIGQPL